MSKGVFLTKDGGRPKFFRASELDAALADGWKPQGETTVDFGTGSSQLSPDELEAAVHRRDIPDLVDIETRVQESEQRIKEETFDTTGNELLSFGSGALALPTMGISDRIIRGLGAGDELKDITDVNPYARIGGEVFGGIATAGLGSGTGLVGTIARATPGGKALALATRGGKAAKAATGSRAAGLIAEGAIDGALVSAQTSYSQAVINNTPVNVERIVSGIPSDVLFGGAFGGAVAGLGKLAKRLEKARVPKTAELSNVMSKAVTEPMGVPAAARRLELEGASLKSFDNLQEGKFLELDAPGFSKFIDEVSPLPVSRVDDTRIAAHVKDNQSHKLLSDALTEPSSQTGVAAFDELTSAGRVVEQELGEGFVAKLQGRPDLEMLTKAYVANKVANQAVVKPAKSRAIAGGLLGAVAGGGPGAAIGAVLGGITNKASLIKRGVRAFAKAGGTPRRPTVPAASAILNGVSFDRELGKKPKKSKNRRAAFKARAAELENVAGNPELAKQRIHKAVAMARTLNPGMADAITNKAMERLMFLYGLVPKSPNNPTFGPDRWAPSNTEIDKFSRIMRAAEHPESLVDDLNSGKLTQEAVDTVKQLYPETYLDIQNEILNNLDNIKANVDYKGRLQLGILFQVPTDDVLNPAFIQGMQMNYAMREQEQQEQGGQFSTPGAAQKSITNTQTASQRVEGK